MYLIGWCALVLTFSSSSVAGYCFGADLNGNVLNEYPDLNSGPLAYVLNAVGSDSSELTAEVTHFRFFAADAGSLQLHVLRPLLEPSDYIVVGVQSYVVLQSAAGRLHVVNTSIAVKRGDRVGFSVTSGGSLMMRSSSDSDSRGSIQTSPSMFPGSLNSVALFTGPESRRFPLQACTGSPAPVSPPTSARLPSTPPPPGACYGSGGAPEGFPGQELRGPALFVDTITRLDYGLLVNISAQMIVAGVSVQIAVLRQTLDRSTYEIRYIQSVTSSSTGENRFDVTPTLVHEGDRLGVLHSSTSVLPVPYRDDSAAQVLLLANLTATASVGSVHKFKRTLRIRFALKACLVACQLDAAVARPNSSVVPSTGYSFVSSTALPAGRLSHFVIFVNTDAILKSINLELYRPQAAEGVYRLVYERAYTPIRAGLQEIAVSGATLNVTDGDVAGFSCSGSSGSSGPVPLPYSAALEHTGLELLSGHAQASIINLTQQYTPVRKHYSFQVCIDTSKAAAVTAPPSTTSTILATSSTLPTVVSTSTTSTSTTQTTSSTTLSTSSTSLSSTSPSSTSSTSSSLPPSNALQQRHTQDKVYLYVGVTVGAYVLLVLLASLALYFCGDKFGAARHLSRKQDSFDGLENPTAGKLGAEKKHYAEILY